MPELAERLCRILRVRALLRAVAAVLVVASVARGESPAEPPATATAQSPSDLTFQRMAVPEPPPPRPPGPAPISAPIPGKPEVIPQPVAQPIPVGPDLSFNFRSAPWEVVLKNFAAEADLSLQFEDLPAGTLSYYDARRHTIPEALDILNGYLLQKGYLLVCRDRFLVLAKIADGIPPHLVPQVPASQLPSCGRHELVSTVLPVTNVDAVAAAREMQPLLSPLGRLVPLANSDRLVVTDLGENVRRIHALLIEGQGIQRPRIVYKLRNTQAEFIARAVTDFVATRLQGRQDLMSSPTSARQGTSADANRLGTSALGGTKGLGAASGPATLGSGAGQFGPGIPSPPPPGGSNSPLGGARPDPSHIESGESGIVIVPELTTNSILISAPSAVAPVICQLVEQLDRPPAQVVIQALLVEVELDNTDEFGVEFGLQDPVLFDRSVVNNLLTVTQTTSDPSTGIQTTNQNIVSQTASPGLNFMGQPLGNNTSAHPSAVGKQGVTSLGLGQVNSNLGYGGLVLSAGSNSVNVLLRALAARHKVDVLSRPQIRTLDNHPAKIQIGQQVPVIDGVSINPVGTANPVIRQDQSGIILNVTPRVSPEGQVIMDVSAEKSQFETGTGVPIYTDVNNGTVIEAPIKDVTVANTSVSMQAGQTIVIGGMITKGTDVTEAKVPVLGDIPIIKYLFRHDLSTVTRKELLIFLTPRIIACDCDSEMHKADEISRTHFPGDDAQQMHGPLMEGGRPLPPSCHEEGQHDEKPTPPQPEKETVKNEKS